MFTAAVSGKTGSNLLCFRFASVASANFPNNTVNGDKILHGHEINAGEEKRLTCRIRSDASAPR